MSVAQHLVGVLPATYLLIADEGLKARGIDNKPLWVGLSITLEDCRSNPEIPVSYANWQQFMRNVDALALNELSSWQFGLEMPRGAHGFLGYVIQASQTVGEALHFAQQFIGSRTSLFQLRLYRLQLHAQLALEDEGRLQRWLQPVVLFLVSNIYGWAKPWLNSDIVCQITLVVPKASKSIKDLAANIGFSIAIGPFFAIQFPSAWLDLKIPEADPQLKILALSQCQQVIEQGMFREDFISLVKGLVRHHLHDQRMAECIASRLNISERTLHRRLKDHDTTLRKLTIEERLTYAEHQLKRTDDSVQLIAMALGYDDPSNFIRFFKQHRQQTPQAFRLHFR